MHPEITKIVKCQKWGSDDEYPNKSFDFLGYRFKPRKANTKDGRVIGTFSPGISSKAVKRIQTWLRENKVFKDTSKTLMEISQCIRQQSRGWINYYGKFRPLELSKVFSPINREIEKWYAKQHKSGYIEANAQVQQITVHHRCLFKHWYWGQTSF